MGHSHDVYTLAISEKEGAIFSGSDDETIKKWDLKYDPHLGHFREGGGDLQRL